MLEGKIWVRVMAEAMMNSPAWASKIPRYLNYLRRRTNWSCDAAVWHSNIQVENARTEEEEG